MSRFDKVLANLRSQPEQNAPPSPHKTATLAELSASNDFSASTIASALAGPIALRASAYLLWITVHTGPFFSTPTTSLLLCYFDFACGFFALGWPTSLPQAPSGSDENVSCANRSWRAVMQPSP